MNTTNPSRTVKKTVEIFSIWSKRDASEAPFRYKVTVDVAEHVATEAVLDAAFMGTNIDGRPFRSKCCSTSSGDLMLLDNQYWFVEGIGFSAITEEQARQIMALTGRDTAMGLEWLLNAGYVSRLESV